ncbi:hypothetical protein [Deinococcus frigens]|uniref:hypothetical protein n=1 Tax=Deinococcus frigens TaxID=249403 RepID=UPI00054ED58C|nr:hypothetical protein [Deinococcus frigens]
MFTGKTKDDLVHELYTWGPALVQDIRSRFPSPTIKALVQNKMMVQKRFTGFEVYVLSGVGLRPYGYAMRYNHVPAKTVVLGALVIRAMARHYTEQGYVVELYDRYSSRKRDNLLLLRRDGRLTILIGRSSITMKSVGEIVSTLTETLEVDEVITVVLGTDQNPRLLSATRVDDLPFAVINLPVTRITRESFTSEKPADV